MKSLDLRRLSPKRAVGHAARWKSRQELLGRLPRGGVAAEVGVWEGDFSAKLLSSASPKLLYLVDPWAHRTEPAYADAYFGGRVAEGQERMDNRYEGVCRRFAPEVSRGSVVVLRARSTDAVASMQPLDWAYIDGDHTYESVKADLEAFFALLRPGGVLAGDDYATVGWWEDGVTRAVDEFIARHSSDASILEASILGDQFVLTKAPVE